MTEASRPTTAHHELVAHLQGRLAPLQAAYVSKQGPASAKATATLAKLRALDPLAPAEDPALYQVLFDGLPDAFTWARDEPARGELAVATALHLYAVHQQGRSDPMHVPDARFGAQVRRLALLRSGTATPDEGVVGRFGLLVRTTSPHMRLTHLRALVQQMRGAGLGLDHARLGADVFNLLYPPAASSVHLRWARDFHARPPRTVQATDGQQDPSTTTDSDDMKETEQS